ncbi:hypothetical protein OF83DRAFT_1108036, partial [Amylostereum chailletii]
MTGPVDGGECTGTIDDECRSSLHSPMSGHGFYRTAFTPPSRTSATHVTTRPLCSRKHHDHAEGNVVGTKEGDHGVI